MRPGSGSRFGPYEIVGSLGVGGMGEVLRARDTRLGREVALKVLPEAVLANAERRTRFEREAQTLAALNHPHIAAIYDILEVEDQRAIVMELVAGQALSQVMAGGPMPVRRALEVAIDVADALGAAHAAGVVHRDLKPANVMLDSRGLVKVLDFGIAKLSDAEPRGGETATVAGLTGDHVVVGTLGYMSPEQAERRPVDGRSDIFSLGVLLYEMLSGRRAFESDSAAGLLSSVLRDDPPPLRGLVPGLPASVERVVSRCLQKAPERRFQSVTDVRHALEDAREDLERPTGTGAAHVGAAGVRAGHVRSWLPRLGLLVVGAAVGAGGLLLLESSRQPAPAVPLYRPFITEAKSATWPAWSPDGRTLAYAAEVDGQAQLFVRGIDAPEPAQVTKGPAPVETRPVWAPDGTSLYFVRGNDLFSVGLAGGEPRPVTRETRGGYAIGAVAISPDGRTIVFTRGDLGNVTLWAFDTQTGATRQLEPDPMPKPLRQVLAAAFSPDGATLGLLASATAGGGARGMWLVPWPTGAARHVLADAPYHATDQSFSWLPDSRRVVFNASPSVESASRLFLGDTVTQTFRQLTAGVGAESDPAVSPDGARVAFVSTRSGIDLTELPVDGGPPVALLQSSRTESYPDMSAAGVLVYTTDADGRPGIRVRVGSDPWSRSLGTSNPPREAIPDQIQEIRLSPDGQRVAAGLLAAEHAIWIYPVGGGPPVRLDTGSSDQHGASWSPDGNWLAYRRLAGNRWEVVKAPLGGGAVTRLADADPGGLAVAGATDWSSTGHWVGYEHSGRLCLVSPNGGMPRVLEGPRPVSFRFSRDGTRLLAVRRGVGRRWELATYDVASGKETRVVALPLASSATVEGLALSPDESRIIVGTGTPTSDIWVVEQFEPPPMPWANWFRRS